jgi:Flp pilus assembly protein CpaB
MEISKTIIRERVTMLESKRRAIIFFVLALVFALVSGFLVLKKVQSLNTELGTMVTIFIADDEIKSRGLITKSNVKLEEIPKKYLRDYHITDEEDLYNQVTVVPLSPGDVITKNILKPASVAIEKSNRLISMLQSDRVFFDEELAESDRVDIIVSHRFNGKEETSIFMKDVKVARVAPKKKKVFQGVQLEVSLEQAPQLIHMQNYADSVRIVKANAISEETEEQTVGK